jgi:catechol 2,3-dioxygenase-like lactoylglutathione lyase family enzyme
MAPAEFRRAVPVLRVANLDKALDYYVRVLGFTMDWRDDDGNSFASLSRGRCRLFLSVGDRGHAGMWIGVTDVDILHEEQIGEGARVRHPSTNYP